jgi:hypothetical protein
MSIICVFRMCSINKISYIPSLVSTARRLWPLPSPHSAPLPVPDSQPASPEHAAAPAFATHKPKMDTVAPRLSRSSTRYGPVSSSAASFSGPVRKWRKAWVPLAGAGAAGSGGGASRGDNKVVLFRWTPVNGGAGGGGVADRGMEPAVGGRRRYVPVRTYWLQRLGFMLDYCARVGSIWCTDSRTWMLISSRLDLGGGGGGWVKDGARKRRING